jgi:sugar phosphate permease
MHSEPETRSNAPLALADATFARITRRLIPFLGVLWILAWIDRVNIGFAKLQMLDDLKFSESVYGFGAGVLFVGYFLFEVPSNLLLARIGARKTIARITICWGLICVMQMFVRTPVQFYVVRFLLGACEAGFYPGIIFFLTAWYPAPRRARAFGLFMSASAIAGVLGGPFAGTVMAGLGEVNGWAGWQWLFLLEGIPSVVAGFVTLAYLPDRPEEAGWLDAADRRIIAAELADDGKDVGPREHDVMSVFTNPKVWLLIAIFFCLLWANSTLTFWAPSIISEAGFSASEVGWIAGGAYLVGAAGMIANGFHSDRSREVRGHFAGAAALGAIGLAAAGALTSVGPWAVVVALVLAISGTMSAIPVFWQLPSRFLTGAAAAAGVAMINSIANLAGAVAPYSLGVVKDATGHLSAGLIGAALVEAVAVALVLAAPSLRGSAAPAQPALAH